MSTNNAGILVTFEDDISDEAVEELRRLLFWVKGVVGVQPVQNNIDVVLAQSRADHDWRMAIIALLKDKANL